MISILLISTEDPLYTEELELRYEILRKPLGFTRADVPFPFEKESIHVVALNEVNHVIGCVLFNPSNDKKESGRLFQMAVSSSQQNKGIGRKLVAYLEEHLVKIGFKEITLHARQVALEFYQKIGYSIYDEPFTEVNVVHRHMRKDI